MLIFRMQGSFNGGYVTYSMIISSLSSSFIMNLWFRLILVLLRRPWRTPVNALSPSVIKMRVWPLDLDLNRHVTNGRYFTMADVGRMDFVLRTGAFRIALRDKAVPIVGDAWGKFRRELRLFQAFEIHTRLLSWDDKWVFMEHRFVARDRVVGIVIIRGLFRSSKGTLSPYMLANELGLPENPPEMSEWLKAWAGSCDAMSSQLRDQERTSNPR